MSTFLRLAAVGALASLLAFPMALSPSFGEDAPKEPGKLVSMGKQMWTRGISCWDCHGNMANGAQEDPRSPVGANLRETTLTVEDIAEVIRCGRPGTAMPYFGKDPYSGGDACYGMNGDALRASGLPPGKETLNKRQIEALSQFIVFTFQGSGPTTQENCHELYGADASSCKRWPTAAELPAASK